jgi:hypothetical protein
MPNHTQCHLEARGPDADLHAMMKLVKSDTSFLDFDTVLPYPQKYLDMSKAAEADTTKQLKDGFNNGGYEWCCKNWGTKWNAYEVSTWSINSNHVEINFQTAWSPPTPVILELSARFPSLEFQLYSSDEGGGFEETDTIACGEVIATKDHRLDYPHVKAGSPTYNGEDP